MICGLSRRLSYFSGAAFRGLPVVLNVFIPEAKFFQTIGETIFEFIFKLYT